MAARQRDNLLSTGVVVFIGWNGIAIIDASTIDAGIIDAELLMSIF